VYVCMCVTETSGCNLHCSVRYANTKSKMTTPYPLVYPSLVLRTSILVRAYDDESEWNWALCQRARRQNIERSGVPQSPPGHHINQREPSWVVGVGEERHLLGEPISSLHVGLSILLRHTGLGQRVAVEWQEHKSSESQRGHSGSSDDEVHVRDGLGGDGPLPHRNGARGRGHARNLGDDHRVCRCGYG
jgi:hypothetical protein